MASSSLNSEGQKRMRVMSLDYFKNSLLRKTSQKTVCCCNNELGLNIDDEVEHKTTDLDDDPGHVELKNGTCKNCGKTKVKHKSGLFKFVRKWLWWQNNLGADTVNKCAANNKVLSECTNCSHSVVLNDKPKDNLNYNECGDISCGIVTVSQETDVANKSSGNSADEFLSLELDKDTCSSLESNTLLKNDAQNVDNIEIESTSLINGDSSSLVTHDVNTAVPNTQNSEPLPLPSPKTRSLTCELLKLSKFGWYWGPISREEAEEKLLDQPDGAFLVRDSSADHYLLSLSFKSSGKILHARIEHSQGLFSFYNQPEQGGFATIVELIDHSVSFSKSAVFCYSRPRSPGHPAFPVRLTKPISRFTQVRSLQYLCRFVIRQYIRIDNIENLPLPNKIKGYIQEGHY